MTPDPLRPDLIEAHRQMDDAQSAGPQPRALLEAFDRMYQDRVGHILFTVLAWSTGADDARRIYSSRPGEYPVGQSKPMGPTAWGDHVLRRRRSWFGRSPEDIRWAFPDHELILSLGCQMCLNVPILWNDGVLGAVSVLGGDGAYGDGDLADLEVLTPRLAPAMLVA